MKKAYRITALEAKTLLEPIPKDDFIVGDFTDSVGKCCGVGHLVRLKSKNPNDYTQNCRDWNGRDGIEKFVRYDVKDFIKSKYGITHKNLADVNNNPYVNGYTQDNPKDRVMALLNDMIAESE
jgi:hypothetical protein